MIYCIGKVYFCSSDLQHLQQINLTYTHKEMPIIELLTFYL